MDVTGICKDGTLTVHLAGELDHHAARGAMREIGRLIDENLPRSCCLELSGLQFMDSSGIGMMIGRYKFMKRRGGGVRVRGMRQPVERVFRMSGLGQIIKNEERTESK